MKYLKYLSYLLLAISVIVIAMFYLGGFSEGSVQLLLNWTIALFVACTIGAVCLPLFFSDGKGMKGTLIKLAFAVVLCGVSYALASGDPVQVSPSVDEPSAGELKFADTGILLTSILFGLSVVAVLSGGLISSLRNR